MAEKVIGKWEKAFELLNVPVHASLLPNGKVLYWGRRGNLKEWRRDRNFQPTPTMDDRFTKAYIWDPSDPSNPSNPDFHTPVAAQPKLFQPDDKKNLDVNLFCSGHCFQPDGTLLVVGGHLQDGIGANQACVFNPQNNTWTTLPPMVAGRWYPSALTLPDGRALVISGAGAESKQWIIEHHPQIWHTDSWVPVSVRNLPLYPRLHLTPTGQVFVSGPQKNSRILNFNAPGVDDKGVGSPFNVGAWTSGLPRIAGHREYAPSVQYDSGKIMYIGGGNDPPDSVRPGYDEERVPTNITEFIDLKDPVPTWKTKDEWRMKYRRQQHNATVLPDGTVLVTGGTRGTGFNNLETDKPVHESELWDPTTSKWTEMDKESFDRCYHSIALLLPDGHVLSAGGGEYDVKKEDLSTNLANAQLYKPPYFFKPNRPTVSNPPKEVKYTDKITVTVGANDSIKRASWVRLGSVTHSNNFNQSLMFLTCVQNGTTVTVQPPATANEAPPGHYMLFLLNQANLPCIRAPIIRIGPGPNPPVKPPPVPVPAHRTAMITQRVGLTQPETNEKIIAEQARPALAVGLTPLCYYGLGPCWAGAFDGLKQIKDIEVVRPVPSQADSVAYVYLKQDILPDIDVWRKEFEESAKGAYVMRGIEMTLSGEVTEKKVGSEDEQLTLAGTTTRPEVLLEPFQQSTQILWDKDAKAPKPITDEEASAYKQLSAALANHAPGMNVQVTGWLQKHGDNKFSLHVRKFEM